MDENNKELAKQISDEVTREIKKELSKNSLGRSYNIIKDLITIAMIFVVVFYGIKLYKNFENNTKVLEPVENHDLTLENNGILGYTAVDFEDAILGSASRKALLIVDEQEVSDVATITKAGLLNLGVFSKNQSVTYYGTAQYTVNLESINRDSIKVDDESHTVTVLVPHAELHEVFFDASKTVFGNSEKGVLAFGDIKLTMEEQNKIEQEAIAKLTIVAKEDKPMEKADQYAIYVLRDFFEIAIGDVTNSYKVKVEFAE